MDDEKGNLDRGFDVLYRSCMKGRLYLCQYPRYTTSDLHQPSPAPRTSTGATQLEAAEAKAFCIVIRRVEVTSPRRWVGLGRGRNDVGGGGRMPLLTF